MKIKNEKKEYGNTCFIDFCSAAILKTNHFIFINHQKRQKLASICNDSIECTEFVKLHGFSLFLFEVRSADVKLAIAEEIIQKVIKKSLVSNFSYRARY